MRSAKSQYSSSVSPLCAKTGMPRAAIAAAAWSCVEKMLHEAQRTSAPSATSVSIRTAVWMVMCSEPAMRAPFSGCASPNSSRTAIRPGISVSAMVISMRPQFGEADILDGEIAGNVLQLGHLDLLLALMTILSLIGRDGR